MCGIQELFRGECSDLGPRISGVISMGMTLKQSFEGCWDLPGRGKGKDTSREGTV